MRAGSLRGLMTIQKKVTLGSTNPDFYEANVVWQDWREDIPCDVEVRRGREHYDQQSKKRISEDVWLFRVRYEEVEGIDATFGISHDGNVFDIRSVRPDAQYRRYIIIECLLRDGVVQPAPLRADIKQIIPSGDVGDAYVGFTVVAEGGTAPYAFSFESGLSVPGLSIHASTGIVSGTPTTAGTYSVAIQVADAAGATIDLPTFHITIAA